MYQALYRKWRPKTFDDVVGQAHITDTLKRQVDANRLSHAYLFTGTRGTGKTTCAKILAKAVNCESPVSGNPCNLCPSCVGIESASILDVLELDAASNNGVDQVRSLRDEAIYTPAAVKKRVYIIDEVHMLSTPAFNALLKILEEPPAHLMFILATTELHKVPATIKSRCQQFAFKRIHPSEITSHLHKIAAEEGIRLSPEAATLLARLAEGGLRDALSLLDQCIGGGKDLIEADILHVLGLTGNVETARLMNLICKADTVGALEQIGKLYRDGKDMAALLGELSTLARDLLIRKTAANTGDTLLAGGYEERILSHLTEEISAPDLVQMLGILQTASAELYRSSNRRTDVELCVIRLCEKSLATTPEALVSRIQRLEAQLEGSTIPPQAAAKHIAPAPAPVKEPAAAPQKAAASQQLPPWEEPVETNREEAQTFFDEPPTSSLATAPTQAVDSPVATIDLPPVPAPATINAQWKPFPAALKGKISPAAYSFLSRSELVSGVFEDEKLQIYVDSDMTKDILGKADVISKIEQEAATYTGHPLRVHIQVGQAPQTATPEAPTSPAETAPSQPTPPQETTTEAAEPDADDKLNDLLKFADQHKSIITTI